MAPPERAGERSAAGLFLVIVGTEGDRPVAGPDLPGASIEVDVGHHLVESDWTRSELYHHVKRSLPEGTAVLVAPLRDDPKFKGQRAGVLAWLRDGR